MTTVYISLGSNVEPEANIPKALEQLAARVRLQGLSTFYRTEPVGPAGQPAFINGVAQVWTDLPPRALKSDILRPIEAALGRERGPDRYAPRPIDLDLLVYGDMPPDPDLRTRPFLAAALADLAPSLAPAVDGSPGEPLLDFSSRLKERFLSHES
jgi:2-amino-4-hydroxy-6-hydroxymethyldihydropteridine diphosphokinase